MRSLVAEQFPELRAQPLRHFGSGWDNVMYRLGDEWVVRLPRRAVAAQLIENEQRWLPRLAPLLPVAVPTPLHFGKPGAGYPWPWSVLRWLPGRPADLEPPQSDQAGQLAAFLRALHKPAPDNAPENPVRGVPLAHRQGALEERLNRLGDSFDIIETDIRPIWTAAMAASSEFEPRWLHGDLHPQNVLVERGRISAVIDWGDITCGDIATDLASIWMLFERSHDRAQVIDAYGDLQDATYLRAIGWAIMFGAMLLDTGMTDNPRHAEVGRRTLERVAQDVLARL